MAIPAPGTDVDDPHWSERRWARVLRGRRGRPLGAIVLLAALVVLLAPETRPLRALRLALFDSYQFRAPRERVSAPAIIVEVDEGSLARHGQWPWPRTLLARLVTLIGQGRPAAIALDLVMPEPDRLSPDRLPRLVPGIDAELAERLGRLPSSDRALARVIHERSVVVGVAGTEDLSPRPPSERRAPVRIIGGDAGEFVRRFPGELRSVDEIDEAAAGHGLLSVDVEGGVVRRLPAVALVAGTLMPTLGIELLRVAAGEPAYSVRVGPLGVEAVVVGDLVIPTLRDGSVWIRYTPHEPGRFVSAGDVLSGLVDASAFKDKLVLIGVTALGLSDEPDDAGGRPDGRGRDPRPAHRGASTMASCSPARGGPSGWKRPCSPSRG